MGKPLNNVADDTCNIDHYYDINIARKLWKIILGMPQNEKLFIYCAIYSISVHNYSLNVFTHMSLCQTIHLVHTFYFHISTKFLLILKPFITLRLDYCHCLYLRISQSSLNHLQMVNNAAARVRTGAQKHEHITPVL